MESAQTTARLFLAARAPQCAINLFGRPSSVALDAHGFSHVKLGHGYDTQLAYPAAEVIEDVRVSCIC
jgi:hypothetical protein